MKKNQALYLALAGVGLVAACWHRLIFLGLMPFDGNLLRLFFPSWVVGKDLLLQGFYFLWDPARNIGQPFLADPQNQALYPLRLLSPFLTFLSYQRIFVVFHCILAAASGLVLGQKLFKDEKAAWLTALLFGFNGFFISKVTNLSHFATLAWVPLILLLLYLRKPLFLGVVLTLQWFAGYPPFFLLTGLSLLIFILAQNQKKEFFLCFLKGTGLMIGLAAIQWIPFLEMLLESIRPVFLSGPQALEYSLHPLEFLRQLILPSFVLLRLDPVTASDPAVIRFYFGPILLALAVWGAIKGKKREKILVGMVVGGFFLSFGQYNPLYEFIPFVTIFRYPAHWVLLGLIGLVFLGTYGLTKVKRKDVQWAVLCLVAVDLLMFAIPKRTAWGDLTFLSETPMRIVGLETIPEESRIFHALPITSGIHKWKVQTADDWLKIKGSLAPSVGVAYGIKEATSFQVLIHRKQASFIERLNQSPPTSPLFDEAGISKIVSLTKQGFQKPIPDWTDFGVIENLDFKPRVFMDSNNVARLIKEKPGLAVVEAKGPGKLIYSQTAHSGWGVQVNDKPASLTLHEDIFLSVDLPEGHHRVQFRYWPTAFTIGLLISILTLVGMVIKI